MIYLKNNQEIELMRQAGRINALAHQAVAEAIKPGVTTKELDRIAERVIRANGATPSFKGLYGFPATICASINDVLIHGIPDNTKLKDGDIISIDIGSCYKGYHGDSACTYPCGNVSQEALDIMEATKKAFYMGVAQAKPGNRLGDICHAIGEYAKSKGYTVTLDYTGHGVGKEVHEEPSVPNDGQAGKGIRLKEGMTLAIEPMLSAGSCEMKTDKDGWTVRTKDGRLTSHYEHSIVITKDGYQILTTLESKEGSNG